MSDEFDKRTKPVHGPPPEFVQMVRTLGEALSIASLLPLKGHQGSLGKIHETHAEQAGTVTCEQGGRLTPLPFTLTCLDATTRTFRLHIPDLPSHWNPLAVFLCQFRYWQFQEAKLGFSLAPIFPKRVAADDALVQNHGVILSADTLAGNLAADARWKAKEPVLRTKSKDVEFSYYPTNGTLEIEASLPEGSDNETVVAELQSREGGLTVSRAVHLAHRLPDGRYKGWAHRFFPTADQGDVTIVVRPLRDDDLHLLHPKAVSALLSRRNYCSMTVTETPPGLVFSVRWSHQQKIAADATTCWALGVVKKPGD